MNKHTLWLTICRLSFCIIVLNFPFLTKGQYLGSISNQPDNEMYFSHLTRENGLPSDFCLHAVQDFRGYVWIATNNGLARYDGRNITSFRNHPGSGASIVDNYVIILKETSDSMLWIGTRNGVSVYNPFTGTFRNFPFSVNKPGTFPSRFVRIIYEDSNGDLWFACNEGLVYSRRGSYKFTRIGLHKPLHRNESESEFNYVTCVLEDKRNPDHLFLSTLGGIVHFDKHSRTIIRDFPKKINGYKAIYDLYMDDKRHLWSCGWFMGLNSLDLNTGNWRDFPADKNDPATILAIYPGKKNEFLLATIGKGLARFNKTTGRFIFTRHDQLNPGSILSDEINHLAFINKNKVLWAVGPEGISIENREIFSFNNLQPPYPCKSITDVFHDHESGKLYAGAWGAEGLFILNMQTAKWSLIGFENTEKQGNITINLFFKDKYGVLWIGTDHSLMYLDTLKNLVRVFKTPDGEPLRLQDPVILALEEDFTGNLWVGTRKDGLVKIAPGRRLVKYYKHKNDHHHTLVAGTHIRAIKTDSYNRVWISNQGGISMYDPVNDWFVNSLNDSLNKYGYGYKYIYNIEFDTLQRMWMTIDGLGLLRAECMMNGSYRFKLFETTQGLDASSISSMRKDANGEIWINNISLVRFNPYNETFHIYNTMNGLHEMMGVGQRLHTDADLNVYIPTPEGIEWKSKYENTDARGTVNLVLEAVEVNGNRTVTGFGKDNPVIFNLKAEENNITFFFTAICFNDVSDIKYKYKLEGYDKDWNLSENSREARYTNLPAGKYEFTFDVLNRDERRNQESLILLTISPYYWQTWWFITIMAVTMLTLIYIAYSLRIRQILRVERIRTRIATDLHDDVGSTLSSVSILSEMLAQQAKDPQSLKMLKTIGDSSSQMMEKMDDIVWVVNPGNDKFRDLGLRLSEYAIPLCESKNIRVDIRFDEKLSRLRLSMDIRRNLYLIAKEAVNNAVKYSECSEIRVIFSHESGALFMEISDNGIGFNPDSPTSRNGLRNMRKRAQHIAGRFDISSIPGTGTRIALKISRSVF